MREIKGYMKALDDMAQMVDLANTGMNMLSLPMIHSIINKLRREAGANGQSKQPINQKTQANAKSAQKTS